MEYILCHFASGLQLNKPVLLCLEFIRVDSQLTRVISTNSERHQCIHLYRQTVISCDHELKNNMADML